jgi:gas vesicle protein
MASFSKGYTYGLLSGALLGAVAAILLAPDKGSNTRSKVTYRIQTYIDELKSLIDELSEKNYTISDAKRESDEVVEDAKQKAEDLLREAESLLNNIKN